MEGKIIIDLNVYEELCKKEINKKILERYKISNMILQQKLEKKEFEIKQLTRELNKPWYKKLFNL